MTFSRTRLAAGGAAAVLLLVTVIPAAAQVHVSGGINPWTGRAYRNVAVRNPWTGNVTTRTRVTNPHTGVTVRHVAHTNPWTAGHRSRIPGDQPVDRPHDDPRHRVQPVDGSVPLGGQPLVGGPSSRVDPVPARLRPVSARTLG
jgi:hypothetical protein